MDLREPRAKYLARPRYKQTEVGSIPQEWEVSALGELITEMRGGAPLSPSDFTDSGVKVLPKGGVGQTGWLRVEDFDLQYCSERYAFAHRRNQVDETFTIVVLRDLVPSGPSIGLMVRIREPELYLLAQGVYGFKVNNRAIPAYLVQLSNTGWYRKLANSIMVGSTQVHITNTAFKLARVPLPTRAEQEAIAEALSDADALIEFLDQLIAKKRVLKQGVMQELLTGKKRLPGFSGSWDQTLLCDISAFITKGSTPTTYGFRWENSGTIFLRSECVSEDGLELDQSMFISSKAHATLRRSEVQDGDLLVTITGNVGRVVRLPLNFGCGNINQHIARVRIVPECADSAFVFQFLSQASVRRYFNSITTGQAYPQISLVQVRKMTIGLPTLPEQTAIATILSDMDTELTELKSRIAKARQIKQGMVQELLTGRIRLL